MTSFRTLLLALSANAFLFPLSAYSQEMDHSKMDQAMKTEAVGRAVINSVDIDARSINLTHEPMPDFGWPKMTMDLPVTRKVDLSAANPGDQVEFTLKLSRDKKYRIIKISPAGDAPSP